MENDWKTLSTEEKYDNLWITVTESQVINPGGGNGIYGKVHFKNWAIGIVPIDENQNTWLVGQYRYTLDEYSWEIPMGGGPIGIDRLFSAKKELKEETGLSAASWKEVAQIHTSNSVTDEKGFIFVAKELTIGQTEFEETESLKVWRLPLKEAIKMVHEGKITDGISMIGLLRVGSLEDAL